jgi:hypothetical protein
MASADIKINLDDLVVDVREKVSRAILEQITEEKRADLITAAIVYLTTARNDGYWNGKSPLEVAFYQGVENVARELTVKAVEEQRDKIDKVVRGAVAKLMEEDSPLITKLGKALDGCFRY